LPQQYCEVGPYFITEIAPPQTYWLNPFLLLAAIKKSSAPPTFTCSLLLLRCSCGHLNSVESSRHEPRVTHARECLLTVISKGYSRAKERILENGQLSVVRHVHQKRLDRKVQEVEIDLPLTGRRRLVRSEAFRSADGHLCGQLTVASVRPLNVDPC